MLAGEKHWGYEMEMIRCMWVPYFLRAKERRQGIAALQK